MSDPKPVELVSGEEVVASEKETAPKNPNSIGELFKFGDLETDESHVYRSVMGEAAVRDLFESGVVRNAQAAGVKEKSRWGEEVFWSRGGENKRQPIQSGAFVLETLYDVARDRQVTKDDITAIYRKNEQGAVENILDTYIKDALYVAQAKKLEKLAKQEEEENRANEIRQSFEKL